MDWSVQRWLKRYQTERQSETPHDLLAHFDYQTDIQTNRQTDKQTNEQQTEEKKTEKKETDSQTDRCR